MEETAIKKKQRKYFYLLLSLYILQYCSLPLEGLDLLQLPEFVQEDAAAGQNLQRLLQKFCNNNKKEHLCKEANYAKKKKLKECREHCL